jgi:hypothetical protein
MLQLALLLLLLLLLNPRRLGHRHHTKMHLEQQQMGRAAVRRSTAPAQRLTACVCRRHRTRMQQADWVPTAAQPQCWGASKGRSTARCHDNFAEVPLLLLLQLLVVVVVAAEQQQEHLEQQQRRRLRLQDPLLLLGWQQRRLRGHSMLRQQQQQRARCGRARLLSAAVGRLVPAAAAAGGVLLLLPKGVLVHRKHLSPAGGA